MTIDELGRLLAEIALDDNRTVDAAVILRWQQILPEWLTYELAHDAVIEHRRTTTQYLEPAHIIAFAEPMHRQAADAQRAQRALAAPTSPTFTRHEWLQMHPEDREVLRPLPTPAATRTGGVGRLLDLSPVDYGGVDLNDAAVAAAALEDHRRGIRHPGLACCS